MKLKITVHGVAYEVDVEVLDAGEGFPAAAPRRNRPRRSESNGGNAVPPPRPSASSPLPRSGDGGAVASPIAGTVVELKCKPGDNVSKDQVLLVIEAMKMKTSIAAPTNGSIKSIPVAVGDSVREGQTLVELA
ncbi:MAG: biotin/lipoyl-binding protein [candidate division Zixibacteria bacterium]|nr:biotin/lipoyl-binding protein [candidate division Zixibacteria bacterium]